MVVDGWRQTNGEETRGRGSDVNLHRRLSYKTYEGKPGYACGLTRGVLCVHVRWLRNNGRADIDEFRKASRTPTEISLESGIMCVRTRTHSPGFLSIMNRASQEDTRVVWGLAWTGDRRGLSPARRARVCRLPKWPSKFVSRVHQDYFSHTRRGESCCL